jgi:hypothetical protein
VSSMYRSRFVKDLPKVDSHPYTQWSPSGARTCHCEEAKRRGVPYQTLIKILLERGWTGSAPCDFEAVTLARRGAIVSPRVDPRAERAPDSYSARPENRDLH